MLRCCAVGTIAALLAACVPKADTLITEMRLLGERWWTLSGSPPTSYPLDEVEPGSIYFAAIDLVPGVDPSSEETEIFWDADGEVDADFVLTYATWTLPQAEGVCWLNVTVTTGRWPLLHYDTWSVSFEVVP